MALNKDCAIKPAITVGDWSLILHAIACQCDDGSRSRSGVTTSQKNVGSL